MFTHCPRCRGLNSKKAIFCRYCLEILSTLDIFNIRDESHVESAGDDSCAGQSCENPLPGTEYMELRWSPLHWAVNEDHSDIVKLLMMSEINLHRRTENGDTPLHFVKSRSVARLLIRKGADVNARNCRGETPLFQVLRFNCGKVVEYLIMKGACVNARNNHASTPLHRAAREGYKNIARILICRGADVNAQDNEGRTPLHCASAKEIATMLVRLGAEINVRDIHGWTPLKCALIAERSVGKGSQDTIDFFREHGGKE